MTWLKEKYKGQMLLWAILFIAPLTIYRFAISDTVQLWLLIQDNRAKKELLIAQNRADINNSSENSFSSVDQANTLSSFLFTIAKENNCIMESYTPYQNTPNGEKSAITITTAHVIITGKFIPLVHVIYSLENSPRKWKIVSTDFKTSKPTIKTNEIQIKLSLIIQYIEL